MKKLTALLLIVALVVLTPMASYANPIQYFYYWNDSQHGFSSWSGWMNPQHVTCFATASYSDPNGMTKVLHVESWANKNTPQGEKVVFTDYYVTNTTASASIGPLDPSQWKYMIARVSVNGGAGGTIYADGTSNP